VGQLGNRDKLGNPGRFLIQRSLAVKFHKENGIVATRERDFESLRPDHRKVIDNTSDISVLTHTSVFSCCPCEDDFETVNASRCLLLWCLAKMLSVPQVGLASNIGRGAGEGFDWKGDA
jgi:hypothetical protein